MALMDLRTGTFLKLTLAAILAASGFSSAQEGAPQRGEATLIRLDSLAKRELGLNVKQGKGKPGPSVDFGNIEEGLPPGAAAAALMEIGPGDGGFGISGISTVIRKILESPSEGGVWMVEQLTDGPRPALVSRLSLEGGAVTDSKVYGTSAGPGWPITGSVESDGCDTLQDAWVFIPKQDGVAVPDQADGFKLTGRLEICQDQNGVFTSRYPGYESLSYLRFKISFKPNRKDFRRRDAEGNPVSEDVPQAFRAALDEVDREMIWFFSPAKGPFLLIEKSRPAAGDRWKITFYRAP